MWKEIQPCLSYLIYYQTNWKRNLWCWSKFLAVCQRCQNWVAWWFHFSSQRRKELISQPNIRLKRSLSTQSISAIMEYLLFDSSLRIPSKSVSSFSITVPKSIVFIWSIQIEMAATSCKHDCPMPNISFHFSKLTLLTISWILCVIASNFSGTNPGNLSRMASKFEEIA